MQQPVLKNTGQIRQAQLVTFNTEICMFGAPTDWSNKPKSALM